MVPTARPRGRDTSWRSGRWRAAWSTASIFSTVSSSKADSPYVKRRDRASGDEPLRCDPAFGLPCVDAKGDEVAKVITPQAGSMGSYRTEPWTSIGGEAILH